MHCVGGRGDDHVADRMEDLYGKTTGYCRFAKILWDYGSLLEGGSLLCLIIFEGLIQSSFVSEYWCICQNFFCVCARITESHLHLQYSILPFFVSVHGPSVDWLCCLSLLLPHSPRPHCHLRSSLGPDSKGGWLCRFTFIIIFCIMLFLMVTFQ